MIDLVDAVCDEKPLLLIIEDIQSLDPVSSDVVSEIITRSSQNSLCLLVTSRELPLSGSSLAGPIDCLRIHRCLLCPAKTRYVSFSPYAPHRRTLSTSLQSNATSASPKETRCSSVSWQSTGLSGAAATLPQCLLDSLDRRLAALDLRSLHVLQACALLGNNATLDRLERVLEYPKGELLNCLNALDTQSVLLSNGQDIRAKDTHISEAATAKLTATGAQYLHRRVAIVLESDLDSTSANAMLWDCVDHYERAGDIDRALALVDKCADYALSTGSPQAAVRMWDRASTIRTAQGRLISKIKSRLIASLRTASLWTRVLRTAAADTAHATDETLPRVHDHAELAVLEARWQTCNATAPLLQQALNCLQDGSASPAHRAEAGVWALILSHNLPHPARAQEVIAGVKALPMRHTHARNQIVADLVYNTAFGDLSSAASAAIGLAKVCRESNRLPSLCRGLRQAATPFLYLGEFARARELLLEALAAAECMCSTSEAAKTIPLVARSYFEEGNIAAAKEWHARSLDHVATTPEQVLTILDAHWLGANRDTGGPPRRARAC